MNTGRQKARRFWNIVPRIKVSGSSKLVVPQFLPPVTRGVGQVINMSSQLIIGLATILDSGSFFRTLIIARQTYENIAVLESSVRHVVIGNYSAPSDGFDLLEEEAFFHLSWVDKGPTQMENNPFLSAKLLQWAVSEGIIHIVDWSEEIEIKESLNERLISQAKEEPGRWPYYEFKHVNGKNDVYICADWAGVGIEEFKYCMASNKSYSSIGLKKLDLTSLEAKKIAFEQLFPVLYPKHYLDYYRIIENPNYMQEFCERLIQIEDEKEHRKELLAFLPEFALDATTGGVYSLCKMLVKIIRRH